MSHLIQLFILETGNRFMVRYALTIFISAFLLFQVQPLIAKYILPWFGGGPSVWTTCMLFFQLLLLGGYTYAHLLSVKLSLRRQGLVHMALVLASLLLLPIIPSEQFRPLDSASPVTAILFLLFLTVGVPYFLLSSTGPLMQRWFSYSFVGRSPYRLYSLSNFGSLLALLSYPFVVEPMLGLREQAWIWSVVYAMFVLLAAWCAVRIMNLEPESTPAITPDNEPSRNRMEPSERPGVGRMLLWLGLATAGSSMLLATTNQMCIDVAVVPFLWVLPLTLYLLTFVICFDNPRWYDRRVFGLLLAAAAAMACVQLDRGIGASILDFVSVYSAVMFACCMCCHGELVKSRPHPQHLTLFYLLVSLGGALGGVFVALVSPAVFTGFWEYHVSLGGACMMTLIAWCVNRIWDEPTADGFWIWVVVSVVQISLAAQIVVQDPAEWLMDEGVPFLFVMIGLLHGIGWVLTVNSVGHPVRLFLVWFTVTAGQLTSVIRFVASQDDGHLGTSDYVLLSLMIVAAVVGFLAHSLRRRLLSEQKRRLIQTVGLQLVVLVGLVVFTLLKEISVLELIALIGVYVLLTGIVAVHSRGSLERFRTSGHWLWVPIATAWILLAMQLTQLAREGESKAIHKSRNFYGILEVKLKEDSYGDYHMLTHGDIIHGTQYIDEYRRLQPTTYYGAGTAIDLAFRLHPRRAAANSTERSLKVGVVGLGTGSIAAYGKAGDTFRFYEINRDVVALSDDHFSYLRDSAANVEVIVGDARVVLENELADGQSQQFDILAIDAFSSDAIPIHLLTSECADLYRRHLKNDGLLLIHISNRYLDLNPVARAMSQHLAWKAIRIDTEDDDENGVYGAEWIVITANDAFLSNSEVQNADSSWEVDEPEPLIWTDDFAALWQVISK